MQSHEIKILETLAAILILLIIRAIVQKVIAKRLNIADFNIQRKKITIKALNMLYILVFIVAMAGIWGLNGQQVLAFITSILAVLGVGFFAQWSLLSNITSGIILYFNHPLKIGDYISIIDKDFPLSGTIEDISLFFIHIRDENGIIYTIPNTVVIQKTLTIGKQYKEKLGSTEQEANPE